MERIDKVLLIPVLLMLGNLLYRFFDFASIVTRFPLDYVNDMSAYVSLLHFLGDYGIFGFVPNWYNGFILFQAAAPGWYLFTYPILWATGNIMLSTFISILFLYGLGAIAVFLIGKELKINKIKSTFLYLLIFANPMTIGGFLKQGRFPELIALVLLCYTIFFALYYKERKFDWKIIFFIGIYGGLLLSHQSEAIIGSIFLLGLFLIKGWKERSQFILIILGGIVLTLWWLKEFLLNVMKISILESEYGAWLLSFNSGFLWSNLVLIVIPIIILILFSFNITKKKDFLFWLPSIFMVTIVLTRLVVYLPFLSNIPPDPWQNFFMVLFGIQLVTFRENVMSLNWKKMLYIFFILIGIGTLAYSMILTPTFEEYTEIEEEFLEVLPYVTDTYFILASERLETSYTKAYYSYASIFLDKNTASGWGGWFNTQEYNQALSALPNNYVATRDCSQLEINAKKINVSQIVSWGKDCGYLIETCELEELYSTEQVCLLQIPST